MIICVKQYENNMYISENRIQNNSFPCVFYNEWGKLQNMMKKMWNYLRFFDRLIRIYAVSEGYT